MKRILTAVAGIVLLASVCTAQQYGTALVATQMVLTSGTSNINSVVTVTKYEDVAVQLTILPGSAATTNGNITASFARSVDGTTYETTAGHTVVAAANGTAAVTTVGTINAGAAGYLKLTTLQNASYGTVTGIVTVVKKPVRFGGN
jgi:hypothetical protein